MGSVERVSFVRSGARFSVSCACVLVVSERAMHSASVVMVHFMVLLLTGKVIVCFWDICRYCKGRANIGFCV